MLFFYLAIILVDAEHLCNRNCYSDVALSSDWARNMGPSVVTANKKYASVQSNIIEHSLIDGLSCE